MEENNKENNLQDMIDYFETTLKIKESKFKKNEKKEDFLDIDRDGNFYKAFEKKKNNTEYMIRLFGIQKKTYLQVSKKLYKREDIMSRLAKFYRKELETKYKEELETKYKEELEKLTKENKELNKLQNENKELNTNLEQLKEENKKLKEFKEKFEKLQNENKELNTNLEQLTKENTKLKEDNKNLKEVKEKNEELNKLKETNEQLQKELDEVKDKQKLNSEVNSKAEGNINQLKEELKELKEKNEELTKENKELNTKLEDLQEEKNLENPINSKYLSESLNEFNIEKNSQEEKKINKINKMKNKKHQNLFVKYNNYDNLILNKKREHKTGNFIKNAAKYYNLNGGAQMAIDKLMKDLENTKGDKKERDKIWQEFANNKSSHLYSKKSRLNELLKAFGTIKSAKHLFQQEDDRLEKKDENIDENSLQQEDEFLKIEDEKKKKNGKLVEQYKTILNMLSNNDALDKTYDGEFLWNSSIVDAIRPELEELQKRVLDDEKKKEEDKLLDKLGDLAIDINEFINKHSVPEIKDDEKKSQNKEEASKESEEKKEDKSKENNNNNKINKINVNNEKNSLDDKEEKNSKNSNSSNKEKQDFSQILSELEKKLDELEKQIKNKPKKTENNKNNEMKKENKEENNKNDKVKGELEKIKNDDILKKIEQYKKQIENLKEVAGRVEGKAKQNQSKGNNKEINEGEEQKIIEDKKKEAEYQNIFGKFNNGNDLEKFQKYVKEEEIAVDKEYRLQGKKDKVYFKQGIESLSPEDMNIILNIKRTDIEKFYNKTHKQTNNNFSEKSLYDISQDIINKLKNMDKGYGM